MKGGFYRKRNKKTTRGVASDKRRKKKRKETKCRIRNERMKKSFDGVAERNKIEGQEIKEE